jgi:hypothetical protein
MKRILLLLFVSFFTLQLSAQSDQQEKKEVLKIAFLENGTLLVDGKLSTKKALIPKLEALERKKGEVYHYQAPRVNKTDLMKAIDIFKLLKKYKVRVIAYADKDFKRRKGQ